LNSKKVLVVDDDAVFVLGLSMILRSEGFDVLTAEDRASTLSAVQQGKPDLVLMDIFLPQDNEHGGSVSVDGFGIMDWLRYIGGVDNTPVIFLTAADQAEHAERAQKAGAVGVFQKTVETAELMGVIHQLLD
jgi:CheY-like chemotaxis protein